MKAQLGRRRVMRDRFYQFSWRPRPPSLLSPEKVKEIARNLRKYSEKYAKEDESLMAQVLFPTPPPFPPFPPSFLDCATRPVHCALRLALILPAVRLTCEPLWAAADGSCVLDMPPNRRVAILRHQSQADAADIQRNCRHLYSPSVVILENACSIGAMTWRRTSSPHGRSRSCQ